METIDDARRAAVARAWVSSSRNQREFAAEHGISERTLRTWVAKFATRQPTGEAVREVVVEAIEKLTAMLHALDAAPATRTADVLGVAADEADKAGRPVAGPVVPSARSSGAHNGTVAAAGEHHNAPARRRGGFFQDFQD